MNFFNIIYYFIWRFWFVSGKGLDKFTDIILKPFKWLFLKIPFVKNRYIKLYGSIENTEKLMKKTVDYVMNNKDFGFNMQFAWVFYGGSIAFYILGIYFIVAHYVPELLTFFETNKTACAVGFMLSAALVTYPMSYSKDRFKKYFKELDKINGWKRVGYKAMTLVFVFGSFAFWFWTMVFANS